MNDKEITLCLSKQLNYGEHDKAVKRCNNEKKINGGTPDTYSTKDGDHIISPQKVRIITIYAHIRNQYRFIIFCVEL